MSTLSGSSHGTCVQPISPDEGVLDRLVGVGIHADEDAGKQKIHFRTGSRLASVDTGGPGKQKMAVTDEHSSGPKKRKGVYDIDDGELPSNSENHGGASSVDGSNMLQWPTQDSTSLASLEASFGLQPQEGAGDSGAISSFISQSDLSSLPFSTIQALGLDGLESFYNTSTASGQASSNPPSGSAAAQQKKAELVQFARAVNGARANHKGASLPSSNIDPMLYPPGSAEYVAAQGGAGENREHLEGMVKQFLEHGGGKNELAWKGKTRTNQIDNGLASAQGDYQVHSVGEGRALEDDYRVDGHNGHEGIHYDGMDADEHNAGILLNGIPGPTAKEAANSFRGDEERPHSCPHLDCDKKFARKSDFLRHYRIHTGERPFVCKHDHCGKSFIQRSALTVHTRVHTGAKPHSCQECQRQFSDSSSLARHRKVHTGLKPFRCDRCGIKAFSRKATLTRHQTICNGAEERPLPKSRMNKSARGRSAKGGKPRMHPSVRVPDDDDMESHSVSPELEELEVVDEDELEDVVDDSTIGGHGGRRSRLPEGARIPQQSSPTTADMASAVTSATRTEVQPVPRPGRSSHYDNNDITAEQQAAEALVSGFAAQKQHSPKISQIAKSKHEKGGARGHKGDISVATEKEGQTFIAAVVGMSADG